VGECGGQDFKLATDSLCVTLVLESGQALGFRFSDEEERDTFALCVTMFIDSRRTDLARGAASVSAIATPPATARPLPVGGGTLAGAPGAVPLGQAVNKV